MHPQFAFLLCACFIAALFYLDRDNSSQNSKGLWVPVVWMALICSRPVTNWLGTLGLMGVQPNTPTSNINGNPIDAAIYAALTLAGIGILIARKKRTGLYLAVIIPIILYSGYCLVSVTWSPVPLPSLKRWIKDLGDIIMVLVIVTDVQPLMAIRRAISRVGFILFPLSVFLIRYTITGRGWNNDGYMVNTGVTMNKNMFGLVVFVITLGALWNFRWLFMNKGQRYRSRRLVAGGVLLALGIVLLHMARSSTAIACFLLGSTILFATHLRAIKRRPSRVHVLCLSIVLVGGIVAALGGTSDVARGLGRTSNLSGRTVIWAALLPTVSDPILGTGFDSYWNSPNVQAFYQTMTRIGFYDPGRLNEAHDGYLETYLNLGAIGVCLVACIIIAGYRRACKAFRRDCEAGSFALIYIMTGIIYNITEAGFRTMDPMWFFILLAAATAGGASVGLFGGAKRTAVRTRSKYVDGPVRVECTLP